MNLPNKLTVLRVVLIVPFVACMLMPGLGDAGVYASVAFFVVASLTDFGKFMDPLADKLLVAAALICLTANGRLAAWISIIIISREFIISGFRLVASDNGIVIAASYWGKFKTTFQMVMIVMLILDFDGSLYQACTEAVTYVALALTVISLVDYIWKNKGVLKEQR